MSEQTAPEYASIPTQDSPQKPAQEFIPKARRKAQARSGNGWLAWFNFLLILTLSAVIGVAGWLGWQHHQLLIGQLSGQSNLHMQQQQEQQLLGQEVKALQHSLAQMHKANHELQQQTQYTSEQLAKLAGANQQDWLIAEAEYLLRLANQRLQLEHDWHSALAMLQAADQVLVETRNPQLTTVRQHLADEMLALRQAPALDRQGAVLRLQSLQQKIPQLPWLPSKLNIVQPLADNSEHNSAAPAQEWYWQLWQRIESNLHSLIRIRERNGLNDAPLTPDQQYYLQQNMHLMLEQAQVALLREEPALYQHSLHRVSEWIQSYLIVEDTATQAVQLSLQELLQWPVAPQLPDISQSLRSLQTLVEQNRRGGVVLGGGQ